MSNVERIIRKIDAGHTVRIIRDPNDFIGREIVDVASKWLSVHRHYSLTREEMAIIKAHLNARNPGQPAGVVKLADFPNSPRRRRDGDAIG